LKRFPRFGPQYHGQHRKWGMPNSLVTFNRFWKTKGTANDLTALYAAIVQATGRPPACQLGRLPKFACGSWQGQRQ
jgi:hypothetical protein